MKRDKQSGIYSIRCVATEKVYIGSSINIAMRWDQHRSQLQRGIHLNAHLQYAWNKYGTDNFEFKVMELVDPDSLLDREQYWMDTTRCYAHDYGYNISEVAGRVMGEIDNRGRPTIAPELRMVKINITIDRDLLDLIDAHGSNRSKAINHLLRTALHRLAAHTDDAA